MLDDGHGCGTTVTTSCWRYAVGVLNVTRAKEGELIRIKKTYSQPYYTLQHSAYSPASRQTLNMVPIRRLDQRFEISHEKLISLGLCAYLELFSLTSKESRLG